jgi:uncharacterized protein YecE (DUF72 family)
MTVYIATPGWQYDDWRRRFYPERLPQRAWLSYYAARFRAVEVNSTFYRLPKRGTVRSWAEAVPDEFVFALKLSRYVTHIRRLKDAKDSVARFMDVASALGDKLGPLLMQLPENFHRDLELLYEALAAFPDGVRVAVELRHDSWFTPELQDVLRRHNVALCLADRGSRPVSPLWRTADWGYVRFHGGRSHPCYGRTSLRSWAARVAGLWRSREDVFAFFNNDMLACAVRDARLFAAALDRIGRRRTRAPEARDVRAGYLQPGRPEALLLPAREEHDPQDDRGNGQQG